MKRRRSTAVAKLVAHVQALSEDDDGLIPERRRRRDATERVEMNESETKERKASQ